MKFNCVLCNTEKEGKKFVYASSTREIKLYVCVNCHSKKLAEMAKASKAALGDGFSLGVLNSKEEK